MRELCSMLITRSVEIKAEVVGKRRSANPGLREIFEFLDTRLGPRAGEVRPLIMKYQHGEAVAWGMMAAALYGHEVRVTPAPDASRIISLIRRMGEIAGVARRARQATGFNLMGSDKKTRSGKLRLVLTPGESEKAANVMTRARTRKKKNWN